MAKKKKLKKSEKRLLIALGVVALFGGIMLYRIYGPQPISEPEVQSAGSSTTETTSTSSTSSPRRGGGSGGSRGGGSRGGSAPVDTTDISKHNKPNDCWVTIDGKAYDITPFIQSYQATNPNVSDFCGTFGFEVGFLAENPNLKERVLRESSEKGSL